MSEIAGVNPQVAPSGTGCVECLATDGWWLHLRRCTECGHIGCCDTSPSQHATAHFKGSAHPVITSYEPGENWFYSYVTEDFIDGPSLAPPEEHPHDQPTPGPRGSVPQDWRRHLNG